MIEEKEEKTVEIEGLETEQIQKMRLEEEEGVKEANELEIDDTG